MEYINGRVSRPCEAFAADPDAVYDREVVIDLDKLEPTVALPHLPENTKVVSEVAGTPHQSGGNRLLHQWTYRRSAHRRRHYEG